MSDERIEVQRTIEAEPSAIFAVLQATMGILARTVRRGGPFR